jgi:hypothetical protein
VIIHHFGHISQGRFVQEAHCLRDATSMEKRLGTQRSGTHRYGIVQTGLSVCMIKNFYLLTLMHATATPV